MLITTAQGLLARPLPLRALDDTRNPDWFRDEHLVGGMCYVDRYATSLAEMRDHIPYFRELGLTYLHLMPLFRTPAGENDGGYAISSFREVRTDLGTMTDLADLATELRTHGISLVIDFVLNHTSDEHDWALRAKAGDPAYQDFFLTFPDRVLPDRYAATLREIFPQQAPGNFTYDPAMDRWVWTTFHPYQWDLHYANPAVFNAMLRELLFLANQGVEVLRMDAVAFIWKQMGTSCENLPQAHVIIEALHLLAHVAAPALIFKSEAIVHPDEVVKYIGRECEISYHPLLMVLLWQALATGDARLLRHSMAKRFELPAGTAWVNYVRSHDDIGWGFANEDCAEIGIDGPALREQLNAFFTGHTADSFARGLPFGYNPANGDMRICGTTASLAGLEQAQHTGDTYAEALAEQRILAILGVTMAAGGIPLLYLGDEVGTLNDYRYLQDVATMGDARWVHRPYADAHRLAERHDMTTSAGRIFRAIQQMIRVRTSHHLFAASSPTYWPDVGNDAVIALTRGAAGELLVLANSSALPQTVRAAMLPYQTQRHDLLTQEHYHTQQDITLAPYQLRWIGE